MITQYKKKDIEQVMERNELYQTMSLIGDKLRSIYVSQGWTHMLKEFHDATHMVEELTERVLFELKEEGQDKYQVSSAGLSVSGWIDEEEYLNLDYYFVLD